VITDRARELGRLIGQSDEYKALRRAHEQVRDVAELQERMSRLHALAEQLERAAAQEREPDETMVSEYNDLLATIQADSRYQAVVAAQANFDKLMLKVNEEILDGIKKGSASPIITLS
jgi:cell fate (sporulation/competence/biofilm development) regulator YlbF (YheA/YmcA/DUF963 family)